MIGKQVTHEPYEYLETITILLINEGIEGGMGLRGKGEVKR